MVQASQPAAPAPETNGSNTMLLKDKKPGPLPQVLLEELPQWKGFEEPMREFVEAYADLRRALDRAIQANQAVSNYHYQEAEDLETIKARIAEFEVEKETTR